ncbi:uncharacterized protein LOC101236717 [Hydra vulgaris]|uniref:uncharacterized protein LOC101236717 n=1 Tax=Hydra vulgaris TaxID=6087 RepID=UPI001F5FCC91|nr:uncharacterized protein LOC101236717 [Hydra vulgaris]
MATQCNNLAAENRMNPIIRVVLQGVYDVESPLSLLRGMPHILLFIWNNIKAFWKEHIKIGINKNSFIIEDYTIGIDSLPYSLIQDSLKFPSPTNLNINMMPFVMSSSFHKCKLPKNTKRYWDIIKLCIDEQSRNSKDEIGKIWFLTIQESMVDQGTSQRRPGLHTESPGFVYIKNGSLSISKDIFENKKAFNKKVQIGGGHSEISPLFVQWGYGMSNTDVFSGGIYMASNIADSCKVWNCQILPGEDGKCVIGELGDIEHLREFLPEAEVMKKNALYWLTDRTPHESLALSNKTHRQYIRIVTSKVSIWYEDHSTKNPLGVVPDSQITEIVRGSKFDKIPLCLST